VDDFELAFRQWQDTERAADEARAEFNRVVSLYLMRVGPAPTPEMVEALVQKPNAALRAIGTAYDALRRRRCAMQLL
jgi:hypothetical protein